MIKRTLQEIADFFDMALAMDRSKYWHLYKSKPFIVSTAGEWTNNKRCYQVCNGLIVDYSGDWRNSLTLPESWTKEPKFKEGEIVVSKHYFDVRPWSPATMDESRYRRPTKAEWKVLKGEEL